jgi:hypothetical protein
MNQSKRGKVVVLLLPVLLAGILEAQQPQYVPPPPPTKNTTVDLRLRYLLSPEVSFSGLGNVPFRTDLGTENNPLLGTERTVIYDDGFLAQDYVAQGLIEGSDTEQFVASSNTAATAAFRVENGDQLPDDDPAAILFHRYAAAAPDDVEVDAEHSGNINWELNYTRYFNANRRLGVQVGFGVTGFDSNFNDTIAADLYIQQFRHEIVQGERPELPPEVENADGTTTQPPLTTPNRRDDVNSGNLLEWAASDEAESILEEGAQVESNADLKSSMYNFKAGPVYNLNLNRRVSLQLAAGVSAIYYNGQFSVYEVLNNSGAAEAPSRGLTTTDESEWQVGGYLDANARYQLTERVNFFSGVQVYSGSGYTQRNEEREVNVDFSSQVYIHAGVGIRF